MKDQIEAKHILLLSISLSALKIIQEKKGLSTEEGNHLQSALLINDLLIQNYPVSNNHPQVLKWSKRKLREWRDLDCQGDMAEWGTGVLATMVWNICSDILDLGVPDKLVEEKIRLISSHAGQLSFLAVDHLSAEEEAGQFAEADTMVNQFYEVIRWRRA